MKFTLTIESDNVEMTDEPHNAAALSLADVYRSLRDYSTEGTIRDANGNLVGSWELTV